MEMILNKPENKNSQQTLSNAFSEYLVLPCTIVFISHRNGHLMEGIYVFT